MRCIMMPFLRSFIVFFIGTFFVAILLPNFDLLSLLAGMIMMAFLHIWEELWP